MSDRSLPIDEMTERQREGWSPPENAQPWRDIESAPKDGTTVLLADARTGEVAPARWGRWKHGVMCWLAVWNDNDVIEYQSDFGTDYKTFDVPTDWQPMPSPPTTDK